jgi:hypothetical protein
MTEPTLKQWKRRALKAEAELDSLRKTREFEHGISVRAYGQIAAMQVAMNEIQDALDWAKERGNESNRSIETGA